MAAALLRQPPWLLPLLLLVVVVLLETLLGPASAYGIHGVEGELTENGDFVQSPNATWHVTGRHVAFLNDSSRSLRGRSAASRYVLLPAVPGQAVWQAVRTTRGAAYRGRVRVQSAALEGGPAELLLTVADRREGALLAMDFFAERMTREWTERSFEFVARSDVSAVAFASSSARGGAEDAGKGAALAHLSLWRARSGSVASPQNSRSPNVVNVIRSFQVPKRKLLSLASPTWRRPPPTSPPLQYKIIPLSSSFRRPPPAKPLRRPPPAKPLRRPPPAKPLRRPPPAKPLRRPPPAKPLRRPPPVKPLRRPPPVKPLRRPPPAKPLRRPPPRRPPPRSPPPRRPPPRSPPPRLPPPSRPPPGRPPPRSPPPSPPPPSPPSPPPAPPPPFVKFRPFPPAPPFDNSTFDEAMEMPSLLSSYNAGNVAIRDSWVKLTFNADGGARWQTKTYTSGLFRAAITCPAGNASGLLTSFFLETHPSAESPSGLGFEFPGLHSNWVYATWTVGGVKSSALMGLSFDCSVETHVFSIYWTPEYSAWFVDQVMVYAKVNIVGKPYVTSPLYLFGSIEDGSSINGGKYAGVLLDSTKRSFFANFSGVAVLSPLEPPSAAPPPPSSLPETLPLPGGDVLAPVLPEYCVGNCEGCSANNLSGNVDIRFDRYCGSRFQSALSYKSAQISIDIKCPDNDTSGMVTSVHASSQEGSGTQDEIDIEFLGNNKRSIQTNYYVNGIGGHEAWHDLGFDCSAAFHNYVIEWNEYHIIWYVDGQAVRMVVNTGASDGGLFPKKALYVYGSLWDASWICGGCWAGRRSNATLGEDFVFYARFRNMRVLSPV